MNIDNHGEENSPFRRRRLPSLNALRCFEAAARLENFSRAAEALCLTHGAISRAVRTLEEELGCALFERRGQRVFLSEAGRRLLAGTGPALDLIERTSETLRAEAGPAALVLSCEPTLLMRWLIPRIAGFMQEQPRLSIQLVAGGGRSPSAAASTWRSAATTSLAARQPCPLAVRRAGRPGLPGERRRTAFPPRCRPARASRRRTAPAHGDPPASLEHLDPSRRTGAGDDRRAALRALLPEPAGGRRRTRRGHRSLATGARRSGRRPAGGATGIPRRRQQLSPADPATVAGRRACHAAAGMAAPQRGGLMRPAQGQARSARSTTASRRSQGTRSLACTLRPNSTVA